jgi:hypothetical protein
MIVPPPPRPRRARKARRTVRIPWAAILLVLLAAVLVAGGAYLLLRGDGSVSPLTAASASKPVKLAGVAGFDPQGDNGDEHSAEASKATDGDSNSAWTTESYRSGGFRKDGVGLVLKTPKPVALSKITVNGGGSPWSAVIQGGNSPSGPFVDVSGRKDVSGTVPFAIDTHDKEYGYYVVWLKLTDGEGQAEVSEVTART